MRSNELLNQVKNLAESSPEMFAEIAYWMLTDRKKGVMKRFAPLSEESEKIRTVALQMLSESIKIPKAERYDEEEIRRKYHEERKKIHLEGF